MKNRTEADRINRILRIGFSESDSILLILSNFFVSFE